MTLIDRVTYFSLKVFKFKSNSNIVTIANSSERFTKFSWISEKLQFVRQIEKLKRLSFFRSWRRKKKERERKKAKERKTSQRSNSLRNWSWLGLWRAIFRVDFVYAVRSLWKTRGNAIGLLRLYTICVCIPTYILKVTATIMKHVLTLLSDQKKKKKKKDIKKVI